MTAVNDRARFLIIDDHPLFREALHSAVQMAYPDVDTVEARSITEAFELLADAKPFDLALLDLSMPDVHGFDGLLQLRTRYPRLPVVIVSGMRSPRSFPRRCPMARPASSRNRRARAIWPPPSAR